MSAFSPLDDAMMERALVLAKSNAGRTRPNPSVGAVISRDGTILGEGVTSPGGRPHGEVNAITAAKSADLRGATMHVTLEPCNHHGRTGPCSEAVLAAGIARVVIAMRDPNGVARGGVERLRGAGVQVDIGLREADALLVNPGFNTHHMLKRPLVTLKWAMTLDGCISTSSGESKWITGDAARLEVHRSRAAHDGVLAGVGTVIADGARLSPRGVELPPGPPILRICIDSSLRLPLDAPFFEPQEGTLPILVCAEDASEIRGAMMVERGAEVWRLQRGPYGVSLPDLTMKLHERGVQSLFVEGGRQVHGTFLRHGLVDRVEAWVAPMVIGGGESHLGPVLLPDPLVELAAATRLHHVEWEGFGGDVRMRGWVSRHLFV